MSYTGTRASSEHSGRVHVGPFVGTHESYPICGALRGRDIETTDDPANCPNCKKVARERGLEFEVADLFETWRVERDEW